MTAFQSSVLLIVQRIPAGKVVSYGQIAAYLGTPRAARQVGWVLRSMSGLPNFPWWRVLNNSGRITIKNDQLDAAKLQKELLEAEGVAINNLELDMRHYRFRPNTDLLLSLRLDPDYIQGVLSKYDMA